MVSVNTKNSQNVEPKPIKMTHITSTTQGKTNDALHKQQSKPNDAALYIDEIGNGFYSIYLDYLKIFACVRWSFG
jgi:hypothetical protein